MTKLLKTVLARAKNPARHTIGRSGQGTGRRLACFVGIAALCIVAGAGTTPIAAAQAQTGTIWCFALSKKIDQRSALETIDNCSLLLARPGVSQLQRIRAHEERAWRYKHLKRCHEAIAEYAVLINAEPRKATHYSWRGYCYEQIDMRREAIRDYRKSLQLDPSLKVSKEGLKRLGG
jgi:tetratricopeptide (TPR) repeat protein